MYRVVRESYENYKKDFIPDNMDCYRYKVTDPLELLLDSSTYEKEKQLETSRYKKIEDFIYLIKENLSDYPNYKSFLWSLESRGIQGRNYGVLPKQEFKELAKIVNMFLRLSYW